MKHKSFIMKTRMIEVMEHGTKVLVVSVDNIYLIMNPKIEYYTNDKCKKITNTTWIFQTIKCKIQSQLKFIVHFWIYSCHRDGWCLKYANDMLQS
jgi:hypothetical protein